jgi:DNA-directed RNA polymerase specialized sigma24 family protein
MPESDDVVGQTPRADPGQLAADKKVREVLAAINFDTEHPLYQRFINELAMKALQRMRGMLASRRIFALVHQRNPQIRLSAPSDWTDDDQAGIADEVVAKAIDLFHWRGLVGGHWTAEGGATMLTYLIGNCLNLFPNVFRRWCDESKKRRLDGPLDELEHVAEARNDLIDALVATVDFEQLLAGLTENQRNALKMQLDGHSLATIAEKLGLPSAKAVENLIRRARLELRRRLGGGDHGTQHA